MRTAMRNLVFLLFICSAFALTGSTPLLERTWGRAVQKIQNAGRLADPESRSNALREAIRNGLLDSSEKVRDEVFTFLSENVRSLDLRPYADVLEEFNQIDHWKDRSLGLIDEAELLHAARDTRVQTYRRAIAEGAVRLPRGWTLTRRTALSFASLDGIVELKQLVGEYLADGWPDEQASLVPAMELRAGAADRSQATQLAVDRLVAMRDEDFRSRMKDERGFRDAVIQVAEEVCAKDRFSGRQDSGCAIVRKVVERQVALERRERRAHTASAPPSSETTDQVREGWLDWLKDRVRY